MSPFPSSIFCSALLATACLVGSPGARAQKSGAVGAVVTTAEVRAELVAHAPQGVAPGSTLQLGLLLQHRPQWHTYWKNPGDSGLPTALEWRLPAGVSAGEIQWPAPKKLPIGPLVNYGYEDRVLLAVPVTVAPAFSASELKVGLKADWLVCKDVCIPESGEFALTLPAQASTATHAALFEATARELPQPAGGAQGSAAVQGTSLVVRVKGLPRDWRGRALELLPELAGVLANAEKPQTAWQGDEWSATLALDAQRSEAPSTLPVLLVSQGSGGALSLPLKVTTPWPATTPPAPLPPLQGAPSTAVQAAAPAAAAAPESLVFVLGLALVGGMLLNLMPCVFPVLALKVLGFAKPGAQRRTLFIGGLAYAAGVIASFVALAAVMLALRAGGEQLGWGFQLQSPGVVAALAALFTLIGLNLAGLFEVGSVLPGRMAAARGRTPVTDHLLTGVLAVAVAAPCTAPFMGASLGVAVTLPTLQALLVFAVLGLGMALPYLAASAWPALARLLPRPGAWMLHFKVLMALPMFATVVWLLWVLGQQVGIDGAASLLALLVVLAFTAAAWGRPGLGRRARLGYGAAGLAALSAALAWAQPMWRTTTASSVQVHDESAWQPWSVARVRELQAQGKVSFVDFTAAWCVTCQFNKRATLANAAVKADFAALGVVTMRADWTRRDPEISAELNRLGRSGVPVYALYLPGQAAPRLLSEILSVGEVRAALAAAASGTRVAGP